MKSAGVDIDVRGIKVVCLSGSQKSLKVLHAEEVPYQGEPRGDLPGADLLPEPAALDRVPGRFMPEEVAVGIGAQSVFLREVRVPFESASQVAETLPYEVEAFLPFPAEETALSWIPLGSEEGRATVLAAAIPRKSVAGMLAAFRARGFEPATVTAGLFALADAWADLAACPRALLVHVEQRKTALVGWMGGTIRFARELPVGVGDLAHPQGVAAPVAQAGGAEPLAEAAEASPSADAVRDRLLPEIRRTLVAAGWADGPGEIRASGLLGALPGAMEQLGADLGAAVRLWEVPGPGGAALDPRFAVAYGLARRAMGGGRAAMELLGGDLAPAKRWKRVAGSLLALEACALLALGLFAWGEWGRFRAAQRSFAEIDGWQRQAQERYFPDDAGLEPEEVLTFFLAKGTEFQEGAQRIGKARILSAWDLFLELVQCIPQGMPLPRFEEIRISQGGTRGGEVQVLGLTAAEGGKTGGDWAWKLEERCEASERFQKSKPISISDDKGLTRFDLSLKVEEER